MRRELRFETCRVEKQFLALAAYLGLMCVAFLIGNLGLVALQCWLMVLLLEVLSKVIGCLVAIG
jgi:hypothetical protein